MVGGFVCFYFSPVKICAFRTLSFSGETALFFLKVLCWLLFKQDFCTSFNSLQFLNEIILGTVVVQPEPVLNEDKDDFKGPEFRSRNTVKMKPEAPKKRGGKYNLKHLLKWV